MGMQPSNSFKISSIQVKHFEFKQVGRFLDSKDISLEHALDASAEKNDDSYLLLVKTDLIAKQEEDDIFYVKSIIMGKILIQDVFPQESLKNMTAIIYSYLRPLVAQMTTMAKLPPLDLPPANFEDFEVRIKT